MVIRNAFGTRICIRIYRSELFAPWLLHSGTTRCTLPTCLRVLLSGTFGRLHLPKMLQQWFGFYPFLCKHVGPQQEGQPFPASLNLSRICNPLQKIPQGSCSSLLPKLGQKGNMFLPVPKLSSLFQYSCPRSPAARF